MSKLTFEQLAARWQVHNSRAMAQGWSLWTTSRQGKPRLEFQRHDEGGQFASDWEALVWVCQEALASREPARSAVLLLVDQDLGAWPGQPLTSPLLLDPALYRLVEEALDNAIDGNANSEMLAWAPERIAQDLVDLASEFEEMDPAVLVPHVVSYLKEYPSRRTRKTT